MSCANCNCSECNLNRAASNAVDVFINDEVWKDAEEKWDESLTFIFEETGAVDLNNLVCMVLDDIVGLREENESLVADRIEKFIRNHPKYKIRKWDCGGVYTHAVDFVFSHELPIQKSAAATTQTSVLDDHTCTACGNIKCSKTEKSCWKCGAEIQS